MLGVTSGGGRRRICKEEQGRVQVPIAFRPIGLIRHNGCPIEADESGREAGDYPPGESFFE